MMMPHLPALKTFLLAAGLIACSGTSFAGYGHLDYAFHGKGWTTLPLGGDGASDMVLSARQLVITGASVPQPGSSRLGVWRLNPDGTRDHSFNDTGEFIFPSFTSSFGSQGLHLAVRPNGRIVISGFAASRMDPAIGGIPEIHVIQLLNDGQLDLSFGNGTGFCSGMGENVQQFLLSKNGTVCVGGLAGLFRVDINGTKGSPLDDAVSSDYSLEGMAEQADGKVVCGLQRHDNGQAALVRVNTDGTQDKSFGAPTGYVEIQPVSPLTARYFEKFHVLSDGKILAVGYASEPNAYRGVIIAKLLANGTPDTSFGTGTSGPGLALIPREEVDLYVKSLNVLGDGRILLAGEVIKADQDLDIVMACLTPTGTLDSNFGEGGVIHSDLGPYRERCNAVVMVSDNELIAGGGFWGGGVPAPHDFLLMRYWLGPPLTVASPAGQELVTAAERVLNFGLVTAGTGLKQVFVKNHGTKPLTGCTATLSEETQPGDFEVSPVPGVLERGAVVPMVISLKPSDAEGVRTATLTLSGTGDGAEPVIIQVSGSKATPQQIWRVTWFGSPDNSGTGADLSDFDGDGLVNFMEYATGANPHVFSPAPLTVEEGPGGVSLTYNRPAASLTEFAWQPEAAASPAGPWSSEGLTSEVILTNGNLQTVGVTPADSSVRRFFRLRVTRQ